MSGGATALRAEPRRRYQGVPRDDLRTYVTAKSSRTRARYNWFVYPHSFSRELVDAVLTRFPTGRRPGSVIYDPFVGAGTTLLACQEMGISAYGIDQLPLSDADYGQGCGI